MKTAINLAVFFLLMLSVACKNNTDAKKAITGAAETAAKATEVIQSTVYGLDNGSLTWTGAKALGSSHTGTINLTSGKLAVANGTIEAGDFVIDMASIVNTDLPDEEAKGKLVGHLKSPDFFDVAQFPTATFSIVSATPVEGGGDVTHNVKGNLTLKGVEKSIIIPANVSITDGKVAVVSPSFSINRTEWGLVYGSGSIVDLAKDKVINDDIALVLSFTASK